MSEENLNIETDIEKTDIDQPENSEKSILDLLGEQTEQKPNHWEQQEAVNENLPDFDPPPSAEQATLEHAPFNPDKPTKKVSKDIISQGSRLAAPVVVELIDSLVPSAINLYAKSDDHKQFCADSDAKENMSNALAEWMGTANVELSPMWVFVGAILAAYAPACISAHELRKAHAEIAKQKNELSELSEKQRETERQRIEAQKREQQALKELNDLKLQNAEIAKETVLTEIKTKEISTKKTPVKKPTKKPSAKPKKRGTN